MRIFYVNDALAIWGGLERILVQKANYLAEHYDYEVTIVTSEQGNHPVPYSLSPKVRHIDLGVNFYQQYRYRGLKRLWVCREKHREYRKALRHLISQTAPDVVVVMRVSLSYDVFRSKGNVPWVFESHASRKCALFEGYGFLRRIQYAWYNHFASKADRVVALTQKDALEWSRKALNAVCIPNIVNLNPTGLLSRQDSKSAICVARFTRQKDFESLLSVWSAVNAKYPDWTLDIYGEGEDEAEIRSRIAQSEAKVMIHKPTSAIYAKYVNSSFLLLTSLYEPFGLVLPEAMSCGLPVVAFDCPYGPGEIISDGIDGFLVQNRDVQAFALRVCQLIEDVDLRLRMGASAVQASQRYQDDLIMPRWKSLFETLSHCPD